MPTALACTTCDTPLARGVRAELAAAPWGALATGLLAPLLLVAVVALLAGRRARAGDRA